MISPLNHFRLVDEEAGPVRKLRPSALPRRRGRLRSRLQMETLEGRLLLSGDPPTTINDLYLTPIDTPLSVGSPGVLTNDLDVDGDMLTAVQVSPPSFGSASLLGDGSFTYVPNPGFHGRDTFVYHANDGTAEGNDALVTIDVNTAPVANDDVYKTKQGVAITVQPPGVLGNDTDVDGLVPVNGEVISPTARLETGAAHGVLTLLPEGSFTYAPFPDFHGIDSFTYRMDDGLDLSNVATVRIEVSGAPVTVGDQYTTPPDVPLTIAAPGVLANDTSLSGDALTAASSVQPEHGSLVLDPNGSFVYTPEPGFQGNDSFTYHAQDGAVNGNDATVSILVDNAPESAPDTYLTQQGVTLHVDAPGVLANDSDADEDLLTAVRISLPTHGTLDFQPNGSFTYVPDADFHGTDIFAYRANDGLTLGAPTTVTIVVNARPVAAPDSYSTLPGSPLTVAAPGVLANDSDANGNPLTAVVVTPPTNGALALAADGSFTYTPADGFHGNDQFTYRVNDGSADSTAVAVSILVDNAPATAPDNYLTQQGVTLNVAAPGVLANDTDADADTLKALIAAQPAHGIVTLLLDGSFAYVPDPSFHGTDSFAYRADDGLTVSDPVTVTIVVNARPVAGPNNYSTLPGAPLTVAAPGVLGNDTDADGNPLTAVVVTPPTNGALALAADGSFTYTPADGFHGNDQFTYRVNDGSADSAAVAVSILVDNAPATAPDNYLTQQGVTLNVAAPGVLANDADADADTLSALLAAQPAHGTVTLLLDGSFTYIPDPSFHGTDSFAYRADDGLTVSDPVTVTIVVNARPVAAPNSFSTLPGAPLTVAAPGVLGNDTDADGNPLTAVLVTPPTHGVLALATDGSFTYTPADGFHGSDQFTYHANDGFVNSVDVVVTLIVDTAPVSVADNFLAQAGEVLNITAPGVLANDLDADNDSLSAVKVTDPTHGVLALATDGSFVYTPSPGFRGTDSFTYRASDGFSPGNPVTVTILVNARPVSSPDAYSTLPGATLTVNSPGVLANDSDADDDAITAVLVTDVENGTLTLAADGSFTYVPNGGFHGTDRFTYAARDATSTGNPITVTIAVNRAPVGVSESYKAIPGVTLSVTKPGVLANDTDTDGDPLTAVIETSPGHGTLVLKADGSFDYTPDEDFHGIDTFRYRANDSIEGSAAVTVSITVNTPPTGTSDLYATPKGVPLVIPAPGVLLNDLDDDGDSRTAIIGAQPEHGSVELKPDGSFTYTPVPGYTGPDSFTYRADDGTDQSALTTVTINVRAATQNIAPVATDEQYTIDQDTVLTVKAPGLLANDTDANTDQLIALRGTPPTHGKVTINPDGSFTYLPDVGFSGIDTFTYHDNDGTIDSNDATVTITVKAKIVNRAAVAVNDGYTMGQGTVRGVTAPGLLTNDTDADGDKLTAVLESRPAHGTLSLNADGSFVYTPDASFSGLDSFTYRSSDGRANSNLATVTFNVIPAPPFPSTLSSSAISNNDTGVAGDSITRNNTPSFSGVAAPGAIVRILAFPSGSTVPLTVGETKADATGAYTVKSNALTDGTYRFTVTSTDPANPNAAAAGSIEAGSLTIKTTAPRITNVQLQLKKGTIVVTFDGPINDLDQRTLLDANQYKVTRGKGGVIVVTGVSVSGPNQVTLSVKNTRRIRQARLSVAALSGGIGDLAGNALDGEFRGALPSGDGRPGGNFQARFTVKGRRVSIPLPIAVASQHPVGVLSLFARRHRGR